MLYPGDVVPTEAPDAEVDEVVRPNPGEESGWELRVLLYSLDVAGEDAVAVSNEYGGDRGLPVEAYDTIGAQSLAFHLVDHEVTCLVVPHDAYVVGLDAGDPVGVDGDV